MKLTSSIALTTYNGEQFFQRQLESIAQQTRLPDELIICDDGSSDRTVEIAKEFASTAPFKVRIYQNKTNLSVGLNFRKAFSLAENDITFFCDQDDVWLPEKIEKVMDCYEKNETVGMVLSRDIVVDANEKPIKLKKIVTTDFEEQPFSGSQFPELLSRHFFPGLLIISPVALILEIKCLRPLRRRPFLLIRGFIAVWEFFLTYTLLKSPICTLDVTAII